MEEKSLSPIGSSAYDVRVPLVDVLLLDIEIQETHLTWGVPLTNLFQQKNCDHIEQGSNLLREVGKVV